MSDLESKFVTIYRLGYIEADVPRHIMESLQKETEEMVRDEFKKYSPQNQRLVGNIQHEYMLVKTVPLLENYVLQLAHSYFENYGGSKGRRFKLVSDNDTPGVKSIWVNFQTKHEFNPPHAHSGDLSFVIYVKVPYLHENESTIPSVVNSNAKLAGLFSFVYVDQYIKGGISTYTIPIDKSFEGKIILFASGLHHTVYPFYTSDEYRISVAGNIVSY